MKSFLIVSQEKLDDHAGEEWDDYLEVEKIPTVEKIDEYAKRIRGRIRRLHEESEEKGSIDVVVDAAPAYFVVCENLSHVMKDEENIDIVLPQN